MREVTEYKWEELKKRLRHRIVRVGENMEKMLAQFNDIEDVWDKVKSLNEKDKFDIEIESYHRILKTMEDLEQEER